ncbi:MAG: hypothetical protein HKN37_06500 [Rhodothermales bacterium]|nr:hypothetical protein [Rhodothermales bacterium]
MNSSRLFEIPVILWGFGLNAVWEFAQSAFYVDHANGWRYVVWSRFHCTVGDVLILLGAFLVTAAISRSRRWPVDRGNAVAAVFIGVGLAYTIWSEWFNTTIRESWAYAAAMPLVFGVGLLPLLQWLAVPTLLIWILRRQPARVSLKGNLE